MDVLTIIITMLCCIITALYCGVVLSLKLPEVWTILDRKPFNCRPCLTFHLTWMLSGIFAFARQSWTLAGIGIVVAFIVFFIVKYIDNKKIVK